MHVIAAPLRTVCGADGSMKFVFAGSRLGKATCLLAPAMLRVRNPLVPSFQRLQRFHSGAARANTLTRTLYSTTGRSVVAITTTAVFLWCLSSNPVHNDAPSPLSSKAGIAPSKRTNSTGVDENGALCAVVWGSNK